MKRTLLLIVVSLFSSIIRTNAARATRHYAADIDRNRNTQALAHSRVILYATRGLHRATRHGQRSREINLSFKQHKLTMCSSP